MNTHEFLLLNWAKDLFKTLPELNPKENTLTKTYLKVKIKSLAEEARIIRKETYKAKRSIRHHVGSNWNYEDTEELTEAEQKDYDYNKAKKSEYEELMKGLIFHKRHVVTPAARHAQLAYGYMRNVPYKIMEQIVRENNEPEWLEVAKNILRFDPAVAKRYGNTPKPENILALELIEWSKVTLPFTKVNETDAEEVTESATTDAYEYGDEPDFDGAIAELERPDTLWGKITSFFW